MSAVSIQRVIAGEYQPGTELNVQGWVRSRRDSRAGLSFLHVHDGSGFAALQVVVEQQLANYDEVLRLSTGCSVSIRGRVQPSLGKGQSVELLALQVTILGWVDDPEHYPIAKKRHSLEYLRQVAHLRPRTNTFGALARIRHTLAQSIHRFFDEEGFFWVNTPLITASDCEGAGELFRVSTLDLTNLPRTDSGAVDFSQDFFGREAFLTVSGQLNVEAFCLALSKVYTFGPTFRAENSNTRRHLAEFWMVEPEFAFADLSMNMDLAERFLKRVLGDLVAQRGEDLAFFNEHVDPGVLARLQGLLDSRFERISYTQAIEILQHCGEPFEFPVSWGIDLQSEHERYLCERHFAGPVFVTDYPQSIKAFYMRLNDDGKTVAAMDLLAPGIGEIIGGSQREERLELLRERMQAQGIGEELDWYQDLRRYGTVPHAGFGLGFERLLTYVTGLENIRDAIPYPRVPGSAHF